MTISAVELISDMMDCQTPPPEQEEKYDHGTDDCMILSDDDGDDPSTGQVEAMPKIVTAQGNVLWHLVQPLNSLPSGIDSCAATVSAKVHLLKNFYTKQNHNCVQHMFRF